MFGVPLRHDGSMAGKPSVKKVQSHQSLDDILDGSSARDVFGNKRADESVHLPTHRMWPLWRSITSW